MWHLKSPFPAFKHWSNVGQTAFRPLVLSTSPLQRCIHRPVHPCAPCALCLSLCILPEKLETVFPDGDDKNTYNTANKRTIFSFDLMMHIQIREIMFWRMVFFFWVDCHRGKNQDFLSFSCVWFHDILLSHHSVVVSGMASIHTGVARAESRAANNDYFHDWFDFPEPKVRRLYGFFCPTNSPKHTDFYHYCHEVQRKSSHCTSWLTFKKPEPANSWHLCFENMTTTMNSLSEFINRMVINFLSNDQLNSRCVSSWKKHKDCIIFPQRQNVLLEFFWKM